MVEGATPFAAVSVTHENWWSSVFLSGSSVRNRNKGEVDNGKYFSVVFGSSDIPKQEKGKALNFSLPFSYYAEQGKC
ncbi:hypothetical protein H5410_032620 [Solanum commersonii]|uniref:Uncharacterized protein n=1 Tax=Solanum commersonii TaxID=4109 RepID=A0A9J5YLG0_SOLCO|nr:hypothetical protein H5410_032620 [Solanum commersonii]